MFFVRFATTFPVVSRICRKWRDCRNNFGRKVAKNLFLIENCHNFAATKETNDNLLTTKNIAKSFNI